MSPIYSDDVINYVKTLSKQTFPLESEAAMKYPITR